MLIEYKVRKIERFIVTRFETSGPDEQGRGSGCSSQIGEYSTEEGAYDVAYAVCKAEHERLGWPLEDTRIQYPRHLEQTELNTAA